jgi:ADP-ribose pyrophosphatase YjhB (NUDIX family)
MADSSTFREPWQSRLISHAALLLRPMTLGVRAMVLDGDRRVLLVRHTYVPGYFLPGGGVDAGETLEQAMLRELREEANVVAEAPYALHGVYLNRKASKRDHVALYVVRAFRQEAPHAPDREIAEAGFFALDALPEATTRATRARLAEVLEGAEGSGFW